MNEGRKRIANKVSPGYIYNSTNWKLNKHCNANQKTSCVDTCPYNGLSLCHLWRKSDKVIFLGCSMSYH
jgi:hypothetical protein